MCRRGKSSYPRFVSTLSRVTRITGTCHSVWTPNQGSELILPSSLPVRRWSRVIKAPGGSQLHSVADAESLKKALKDRQSELVSLSDNLVDVVWGSNRPARTLNPVSLLSTKFSGILHDRVVPTPC